MKDRLIELIKEGKRSFRGFCPNCDNDNCENCENAGIADYLLTNGVIVPPCRVGDTVYSIFVGKVNPSIIGKLEISINCWDVDFSYEAIGELCPIQFCKENIGKTVFLTREEAERSIK